MMKALRRIRTAAFLLLLTAGAGWTWAADGITTTNYQTDFASSIEPFDAGDIAAGTNVSGVLRVTNTTATANFANTHQLNANETVTVQFSAYHGYLYGNSTSKVQLVNSDGQVLVGYTYNHHSVQITDVTIGGTTVSGFTAFDGASYWNTSGDKFQNANGLTGGNSGKPYLNDDNANPKVTMTVNGGGSATLYIVIGKKSIYQWYSGSVNGLTKDLSKLEIISTCSNSDRTICIDNLSIWSSAYGNDYESGNLDWTTSVSGRYDPVILEESGNHYLSVTQDKRSSSNNNGATLKSSSLGVTAGSSYQLTFDLKVSSSNGANSQAGTKFTVYDANNSGEVFSLQATAVGATTWILNGDTENPVSLPNTSQGTEDISTVPWYRVTVLRSGTGTWVTIKDGADNVIVNGKSVAASTTGGLGIMEFVTMRYNANFAIDNIFVTPILDWSAGNTTVNIKDVGDANPNMTSSLPYIHSNYYAISSLSSSNTNVASFWSDGKIHIKGVGSTTLTVTDVSGYTATTTLTVSGTQVEPTQTANTLTFGTTGYIVNNASATGSSYTLSTGLRIDFGYSGETSVVVNNGSYNVVKIIDANGFSHPNLAGSGLPYIGAYGGTFVTLTPLNSGSLTVVGNVSAEKTKLYRKDGVLMDTDIDEERHTLSATLTGGSVYYLYNGRTSEDEAAGSYSSPVHAVSFANPLFVSSTAVIEIPSDGSYTVPAVGSLTPTSYTLTKYGELADVTLTVSGSGVISGITAGGAILVRLSDGTSTAYHLVTVAYPSTEYPGHLWDFNIEGERMTTAAALRNVPVPTTTITAEDNNSWTALYKVNTGGYTRAPEWRLNRRLSNDNAIVVPETAGLLFSAKSQGFYMRNDDESFRHVGIHGDGTSFTIPYLKRGDIVELNWKHDAANSGSTFIATNLTDLRNKPVSEQFLITESAYRTQYNHPGRYSFIVAADGDVTFTLKDAGFTDILSIRIYRGPYRSTMRNINAEGNVTAETTMLLDNAEQEYSYNYCNQLYSTATGPAFYVLKGWRKGIDPAENVTGADAGKTPTPFTDDDESYPAYPVTDDESQRLYDLRKNIQGLEMYNHVWQSKNNSYSFGRIKATGGWGKVTIRMNNYTNDMKYVIGYTPDYTLTVGSAPHQSYPYTWDFTNISAQAERGKSSNAYNTIMNQDLYGTNWENLSNGVFSIDVDNAGSLGSQYVPGAVLVTTDRALSKITGVVGAAGVIYALDEFDGLGVNGKISFDSDSQPSGSSRKRLRRGVRAGSVSLLSFTLDDYKIANTSDEVDGETVVTDWRNATGIYQSAGNGWVKFGADKITETTISSCGFAYKCDLDAWNTDRGVYLRPARKLKIGDVITVKIFATSSPSGSNYGVSLYGEDSDTPSATLYLGNKQKNTEVTLSYTLTEGDGLVDASMIKLFRNASYSVYLSEVQITGDGSSDPVRRELYCETATTLTIPDVGAGHRIYVSSSVAPESVSGATLVVDDSDAADGVWRYDVAAAGNVYLTFPIGSRIYKIGVTDILKTMHAVAATGWATESRNHSIDHTLTGYFTLNDANAYSVSWDSYDLETATVALTAVEDSGYVSAGTGIVLRQDNNVVGGVYEVPLFYPSYTRRAATVASDNMMVPVVTGGRQWLEVNADGKQKFILTNVHWRYSIGGGWGVEVTDTDAAGFYRLHVWGDASKDVLPDNCAYLGVPEGELPVSVWNAAAGTSREGTLGIRDVGDGPTSVGGAAVGGGDGVAAVGGAVVRGTWYEVRGPWYSLDGTRLSSAPTKAGIYVCGGKRVVVR